MRIERQKETGVLDVNLQSIEVGDKIKLFNQIGAVSFESGTYGIAFDNTIDYDYLASEIYPVTGCDNSPYFCGNDNFISFWELLWNFNCEEDCCTVVEIVS